MDAIQFNTVVGDDRVIRIPEGMAVRPGLCEVTITAVPPGIRNSSTLPLGSWEWLRALAAEAELDPTDLPSDMAENHDFYAHGKPRE